MQNYSRAVGVGLVALLGAMVSPVRAQGVPVQLLDLQDSDTTLRVAGELGIYSGMDPRVTQLQSLLYFGVAPSEAFELTIEWAPGGTILSEQLDFFGIASTNKARFTPSNPTVTAFYRHRDGDLQLRLGAGIALPLTFVDETDNDAVITEAISLTVRTATWGAWDIWILAPERLSFVLPFQLEARLIEQLALGTDLGVGFMIPLESAADPIYSLQLALWLAVVADPIMVGLRMHTVGMFSPAGDPQSNVALAPFIQADLGAGFVYTRFLVNVGDGMYGDTDLLWSVTVGGGGDF